MEKRKYTQEDIDIHSLFMAFSHLWAIGKDTKGQVVQGVWCPKIQETIKTIQNPNGPELACRGCGMLVKA